MNKIIPTIFFAIFMFLPSFSHSQFLQSLAEADILGDWQCESLLHGSTYKQGGFVKGWQVDPDGLTVTLPSRLKFARAANGSYRMTSTSPNPVNLYSTEGIDSPYRIKGDQVLVFTYFKEGTNYLYEIRKISDSRMSFYPVADGFHPTLICDKVGASVSGAPTASGVTSTASNGKGKE